MIELINEVSNGNKRAFSKLVGVNPTVIENIVGTRKGKPGYDLLEKIAFAIENINIDWLLTGRNTMFHPKQSSTVTQPITHSTLSSTEESVLYKIYKEKEAKVEQLLKETGRLEERIRQLEANTSVSIDNEFDNINDSPKTTMLATHIVNSPKKKKTISDI